MPYDKEKDVVVKDLGDVTEDGRLFASLRCYDGGPRKLSISLKFGKEGSKSKQIVRLSLADAAALNDFLTGFLAGYEAEDVEVVVAETTPDDVPF